MQKKYIFMLFILLIILFIYIILHYAKMIETFDGDESEFYIFGYGSLVNNESRKTTIKLKKSPVKAIISENFPYSRSYEFKYNTSRVLGLKEDNSYNKHINGIIFKVKQSQLDKLDEREKGYKKIVIPWSFLKNKEELLNNNKLNKNYNNYTLFTYIPSDEMTINTENNTISYNYLDKVYDGFQENGDDDFLKEFINNTDNLPSNYNSFDKWINS